MYIHVCSDPHVTGHCDVSTPPRERERERERDDIHKSCKSTEHPSH